MPYILWLRRPSVTVGTYFPKVNENLSPYISNILLSNSIISTLTNNYNASPFLFGLSKEQWSFFPPIGGIIFCPPSLESSL